MTVQGNILVADYTLSLIRQFSPTGVALANFAAFADPTFLESDRVGNVYTNPSALGAPVSTRFNAAGAITQTYTHATMVQNAGVDADVRARVR